MAKAPGWYVQTRYDASEPELLRYWDGRQWTEHTAPVPQPGAPGGPGGYGYAAATAGPPATPDGVRLAGWWQRVGALVLDTILVGVVSVLAALPLYRHLIHEYVHYFHEVSDASENGTQPPSSFSIQRHLAGTFALIGLIGAAVNFVYFVALQRWKQASLGMLALGLRVRLWERDALPTGAILMRWLAQFGPQLLSVIPFVGTVAGLYGLLDDLWPLWDDKKQALHDKVAGTAVVRLR